MPIGTLLSIRLGSVVVYQGYVMMLLLLMMMMMKIVIITIVLNKSYSISDVLMCM